MTDKEWWDKNLHAFSKGTLIRWNSDLVIAIKEHGLPDCINAYYANTMLRRLGSDYRVPRRWDWDRGELLQLRAISNLPLLKRRGWTACLRMAYRKGYVKTAVARTDNDKHKDNHKE